MQCFGIFNNELTIRCLIKSQRYNFLSGEGHRPRPRQIESLIGKWICHDDWISGWADLIKSASGFVSANH